VTELTVEEILQNADLPTALAGCQLLDGPGDTYDIQSRGKPGGHHGTLFRASGDTAVIVGIGKVGRKGRAR
jgi:hypothetical protein